MDPYHPDGELAEIHNAFHQGRYETVMEEAHQNNLYSHMLGLRAKIALGKYKEVLKEKDSSPDIKAAKVLAEYSKNPTDQAVGKAEALAAESADNLSVQLLCGTVLARAGKTDEALMLLSKHEGCLDAVALMVQIHLQQNRLDLALKEAAGARKWAQDSLLVNIIESWTGMREGGDKYQAAYYVFEELAQADATRSIQSLVGQAVSEIHLGRLPEAEAALQQAVALHPDNPHVLANMIVLNNILGKDTSEERKTLEKTKADHELITNLAEMRDEFEKACQKYTPKLAP